ncbi:MAG: hypothetical protein R3F02_05600 [Thiolinea sp.]
MSDKDNYGDEDMVFGHVKCVSRRRKLGYIKNDTFIQTEPYFLSSLPAWHQSYFTESQRAYTAEAKRVLRYTALAIRDVTRVMSIRDLCLLLFPYPACWWDREKFKHAIFDAVRLNNFKLRENDWGSGKDACKPWLECQGDRVELEAMEFAAKRGWLLDYDFYIPIWRRYVEEKENEYMEHHEEIVESKQEPEWLLKEPKYKKSLTYQVIEQAYQMYLKNNNKNPVHPSEVFKLITPENIPGLVTSRSESENLTSIGLTLRSGVLWNYQKFQTMWKSRLK